MLRTCWSVEEIYLSPPLNEISTRVFVLRRELRNELRFTWARVVSKVLLRRADGKLCYVPSSTLLSHMKRMTVDALKFSDRGHADPSVISSTGFPSRTWKVALLSLMLNE